MKLKNEGKVAVCPGEGNPEDLTDEIIKNNVDGLKKTGKKMVEK